MQIKIHPRRRGEGVPIFNYYGKKVSAFFDPQAGADVSIPCFCSTRQARYRKTRTPRAWSSQCRRGSL